MSKYLIRATASGIKFDLKAPNGQTIASSEVYKTRAACLRGIASIQKNAPAAAIEDHTQECILPKNNPKFEMYRDKAGQFRFRLKARNGKIIAVSEGYTTRSSCENGMDSVIKNAALAEIEEE